MNKNFYAIILACLLFSFPGKIKAKILGGAISYEHVTGLTYNINIILYGTGYEVWNGSQDLPILDSVHIGNTAIVPFYRNFFYDIAEAAIRISYYSKQFTFPSPGSYQIYLVSPGRIGNIANIPNSFFSIFSIKSELVITPTCPNTSVSFADIPIFFAQHNRISTQNINVLNPDHDSLSFELVPPLEENAQPMTYYSFPPGFIIDPVSGELSSVGLPDSIGKYSFAVKVSEWSNGIQKGSVLHEFVLETRPDTVNTYYFDPLSLIQDAGGNYFMTVNPGDTVSLNLNYVDSSSIITTLSVYGEAFHVGNPANSTIHMGFYHSYGSIFWIPDSTHSRPYPYIFTCRGTNGILQTELTILIYVNGVKPDSCYTSPIGIEELSSANELILFPNPVKSEFTIGFKSQVNYSVEFDAIEIYNSLEEKVFSSAAHSTSCIVHCASFPPGIYFVKAISGDKIFYNKFIKE